MKLSTIIRNFFTKHASRTRMATFLLTAVFSLLPAFLFAQMEWICATDSAGWLPRGGYTSVVFDNKIWVIGGYDTILRNDVWYSIDGMNWLCATDSAEWSPRTGHASVVFDNKIWVLGGCSVNHTTGDNDVWFSTDGVNWTCATDSAEWFRRGAHTAVIFNNNIWVIGGTFGYPPLIHFYNDVWFSTNGVNWYCATDSSEWSPRDGQTSVVFDNKIWILGGYYFHEDNDTIPVFLLYNDVWNSTDGANWICATDSAEWSKRDGHTMVSFNNKMWIMGGMDSSYRNDVWYSGNGVNWIRATDSAGWSARVGHKSVVFNGKIWITGGYHMPYYFNDVWYSTGLGIEEESTKLDAEPLTPEIYPNPARSFLAIRLPPTAYRSTLKLFDISGKLIKVVNKVTSAQEHKQEVRISLKGINQGIYFLKLGTEVKKFLVVK